MKKKNIVLYVTILLVGIIISGFFLPFHTVPDTYNVLQQKQEYCTTFIKDGRIFSALFLFLGIKLNIPITLLCIVSNIIALLANCTSVYIIFKTIECKENNYWKNVIMLMGSFLLVFNQFAMEHLAYFETGIICIGKLLSIIAAKKLIINNVKIKSIGILILSVFCYQGILNVFVLNAIIFSIVKDKKIKKMSKNLLYIILICIIVTVIAFIEIKICNNILKIEEERITTNQNISLRNFKSIVNLSTNIFAVDFNIMIPYFLDISVITTLIILLLNKEYKIISIYLISNVIIILSCTMPLLFTGITSVSARTISAIAGITGLSIILMCKDLKINLYLILIVTIWLFGINEYSYLSNGIKMKTSNVEEKEYMLQIVEQINKYENSTGKRIEKIAIYYDENENTTFLNYINNSFTCKTIYTKYARMDILRYYLNRNIKEETSNKYELYFKTKDWDCFNKEQFIFEDNTLYICVY